MWAARMWANRYWSERMWADGPNDTGAPTSTLESSTRTMQVGIGVGV